MTFMIWGISTCHDRSSTLPGRHPGGVHTMDLPVEPLIILQIETRDFPHQREPLDRFAAQGLDPRDLIEAA